MAYQVFNGTLPIVRTQIDSLLSSYPQDHIYNYIVSVPYLKEKLVAEVLNQIPNYHLVIDKTQYFNDDTTFFINNSEQELLIQKKIVDVLNNFTEIKDVNFLKNMRNNQQNIEDKKDNPHKLAWWIKIETSKPLITYFFGPFATFKEADINHYGYLEDLKHEKAEGISFSFHIDVNEPQKLTIVNDLGYLQQENDALWNQHYNARGKIQTLQEIQNKLYYESRHDYLTNLPNRRLLLEFLTNILGQQDKQSSDFAVLFLDLNKFKLINDTFGHETGDHVLIIFAKRLIRCVRKCDRVARLNGDEFMAILTNIKSAQDGIDCSNRIHLSMSKPFKIKEKKISVSVSIGIVTGNAESSASKVLATADKAMYKAKYTNESYAMYHC